MSPERLPDSGDSNEEFRRFFRAFAHDFQQSVSKIVTISEFLVERLPDVGETEKDYLVRMNKTGHALKELMRGTSEYVSLLQLSGQHEPVRLRAFLDETLASADPAVRAAAFEFKMDASATVLADKAQVRLMFRELFANAVKFAKKEAVPQITVECASSESTSSMRIYVSDRGIGFDEKFADKIFEPFQTLHSKNEYPGSGLGLAIVQKVVRNHGGRASAFGKPGEGSRFVIELPAAF